MPPIDRDWILAQAEELQEVRLAPEQAERLAALLRGFNAATVAQASRLAFETEPSGFVKALLRHKDREDAP
jgi:hypothetical protein